MANYNTTATVTLSVSASRPNRCSNACRTSPPHWRRKISKAATAGDKATMSKAAKATKNKTNGLIQQLQSSAKTAEQVLARMDRATPRELNKALRTLQSAA